MNYGRQGIRKQQLELNAKGPKWVRKLLLILTEALLIGTIGAAIIIASFGIGIFSSIISTAPDISTINVSPTKEASFILDCEGNEIWKLVSENANRIIVGYDQIPINLEHAFVAIEDQRFYQHNGIDIQGIARAGIKALQTFHLGQGASTITQQLLKNNVFTDWLEEDTNIAKVKRKIQEQYLAIQLEKYSTKEGILTSYLNTINLGHMTLGVQSASLVYFGKNVSELTLSECALLAGITQNPSANDPILFPENSKKRTETVLEKMLELEFITQEEYDEAMADDVYSRIENHHIESVSSGVSSYFADAVIEEVIKDLKAAGYSENQVYSLLYSGGLKINSTMDPDIQAIVDEAVNNEDNYPDGTLWYLKYKLSVEHEDGTLTHYSSEMFKNYFKKSDPNFNNLFKSKEAANEAIEKYKAYVMTETDSIRAESIEITAQPQISLTICDQKTGYVKAIAGGRGEKIATRGFNRATQDLRQPGSCFKVLAAFAPAIDSCGMTLATVYNDAPFNYNNATPVVNWYGKDVYKGLCNLRYGVYYSLNVVAIKTITQIGPELGFNYLKNFGFTTLVEADVINDQIYTDIGQPLALGGITNGVYNIELNAAYAAIANMGTYIKPKLYTTITDSQGNIILDNRTPVTRDVISPQTAFLLTDAMTDCVEIGTGTTAKFNNMSIAGKTGTTTAGRDVWFAGFTPYYTCTIWAGYDNNEVLRDKEQKVPRQMFKRIMSQIHEGFEDPGFTVPDKIVSCTICTKSGKLPIPGLCDDCLAEEYFTEDTVPTTSCDVHYYGLVCAYDNQPATDSCPFAYYGVCERLPVEDKSLWKGSEVFITTTDLDPLSGETITTTVPIKHTGYCQHDADFYSVYGWEGVLDLQRQDYSTNIQKLTQQIKNTQAGERYLQYQAEWEAEQQRLAEEEAYYRAMGWDWPPVDPNAEGTP